MLTNFPVTRQAWARLRLAWADYWAASVGRSLSREHSEEGIRRATRAVCANQISGGYCECIGHEEGCMAGYGEAPHWQNCKMRDNAMPLTAEYKMARAALDAIAIETGTAIDAEGGVVAKP